MAYGQFCASKLYGYSWEKNENSYLSSSFIIVVIVCTKLADVNIYDIDSIFTKKKLNKSNPKKKSEKNIYIFIFILFDLE